MQGMRDVSRKYIVLIIIGLISTSIFLPMFRSLSSSDLFLYALKLYIPNVLSLHYGSCQERLARYIAMGKPLLLVLFDPKPIILRQYLNTLPKSVPIMIFGNVFTCKALGIVCLPLSYVTINVIGFIGGIPPYGTNVWRPIIVSTFIPSTIGILDSSNITILAISIGPKGKMFPIASYLKLNGHDVIFASTTLLNPYLVAINHELPLSIASWVVFLLKNDCCRKDAYVIICSSNASYNVYDILYSLLTYYVYQLQVIWMSFINIINTFIEVVLGGYTKFINGNSVSNSLKVMQCIEELYSLPVFHPTSCGNMYDYTILRIALTLYASSVLAMNS